MASLTHVCMWSEHGWVYITAEEAARLHPGGTVSAHSGLFMCELCGQYVSLTDGEIRTRYFRHSSTEKDKSCPERTFGPSYIPSTYIAGEHELPIRISLNHVGFQLELGLVSIPEELIDRNYRQSILIKADGGKEHIYSFERLASNGITYFSIGKEPAERYFVIAPKDVSIYWPRETKGIPRAGAIFDGSTKKMLSVDSDVKVNEKYYLLRQGNRDITSCQGIQIKKISEQQIDWLKKWQVYEVLANELSEGAAKFFLDYGYRLTDKPVRIKPIWPIHIETPLVVKHNKNSMIMHITGVRPVVPKSFPETTVLSQPCVDKSRFVHVNCKARQQLISVGSAKVLQYFYFWRESLDFVQSLPSIEVVDSDGVMISAGMNDRLPKGAKLYVKTPFDGIVTLYRDERVVEKLRLPASQTLTAIGVAYGVKAQIRIGLDIVWEAEFARVEQGVDNEDEDLYQRLVMSSGKKVIFPHSWGALIKKYKNYPMTKKWIQQSVKKGFAPERAMKLLERHFTETRR